MTIHQEISINASPADVYNVLVNSAKFSEMTGGAPADISKEEGGVASLFGGYIMARQVELVEGTRVVQTWRSKDWEAGLHSLVWFELSADAGKTKVKLTHSGFPEGSAEHLDAGWHKMYWVPMAAMFAS